MARIIGGVATSHTPTIGFAYDQGKQDDVDWAPIFAAFEPVSAWFKEKQPDAIVYIFNDHVTSFFFDHYSAFTLGIGEEYPVADEGGGARRLPAVPGNPKLAAHIAQSLVTDEFDLSYFQDKPLDHGFFSPMAVLLDREDGRWPTTIVPFQVGVLQFPLPTAARCYKMGQALRRAIESYPEDIKVAVVATGGLSHQVHGERAGFNNPEWDREFLDRISDDPASLTAMTHAEFATLGGLEGAEVIMWLVMRGALSDGVERVHSSYYLPSMTGIATLVLNDEGGRTPEAVRERHRERMAEQLRGSGALNGTYLFDIAASVKAYRINKYLHAMIDPDHRARFLADPETSFKEADLSDEEKRLIRTMDWQGLIHYGVIFFMLEKLAAVTGASNLDIYAAMRGESLDDFLETRNTQVIYSVAGNGGEGDLALGTARSGNASRSVALRSEEYEQAPERDRRSEMSTVALTEENFEETVTKDGITLVDWWASWCGPCRMFSPIFEAASETHADITFGKIDTEDQQALARAAQITSIPTLMAFRDGVLVFSQTGALPSASLEQLITAVKDLNMNDVHASIAEQANVGREPAGQ